MTKSRPKTVGMAIKVDPPLAAFLRSLPNASEFIRFAVAQYTRQSCPLCGGAGHVSPAVGEHFAEAIEARRAVACARCGAADRLPEHPTPHDDAAFARWNSFAAGAPFYCLACFAAVGDYPVVPESRPTKVRRKRACKSEA